MIPVPKEVGGDRQVRKSIVESESKSNTPGSKGIFADGGDDDIYGRSSCRLVR
jgi:hypothetical protein